MPASARIIVKYVDAEAGRVGNEDAARDAARILSEIAGAEIRHLRLMSGNAQVVELVGIQDPHSAQAQQQIESVIQRLEADPAVDYAELDAIMRIQ